MDLVAIKDAIKSLSLADAATLVKQLEEELGVSAAAPVAVAAGPAAGGGAAQEAVQDSFTVILANGGAQKINVIKVVREITGLGLKEAKELVDAGGKPVKEGVAKAEAEEIKKKLTEAGATVEIK